MQLRLIDLTQVVQSLNPITQVKVQENPWIDLASGHSFGTHLGQTVGKYCLQLPREFFADDFPNMN